MYILTVNHQTTTYSSPIIAASVIACIAREEISLHRFIDILENMADGELFAGTNFVVQCFGKEKDDESC